MFTQSVMEQLNYYVYFLQDPRTNKVFYVGKGTENRIFNHIECAIETDNESDKLEIIREIMNLGLNIKYYILRHGLTEEVAFEVEASLIDFIGIENLSNIQGGHYSDDYGLKTVGEISMMYDTEELKTDESIILININRLYKRKMTEQELYEATRKSWVVGARKNKAKYAIATYRGLTREIYKIENWFPIDVNGKTRWGFNGVKASTIICDNLRYKSIKSFFVKGAVNPIKYINC